MLCRSRKKTKMKRSAKETMIRSLVEETRKHRERTKTQTERMHQRKKKSETSRKNTTDSWRIQVHQKYIMHKIWKEKYAHPKINVFDEFYSKLYDETQPGKEAQESQNMETKTNKEKKSCSEDLKNGNFKKSTENVGSNIHPDKTNILSNQSTNKIKEVEINNIKVEMLLAFLKAQTRADINIVLQHRLRLFKMVTTPTLSYTSGTWTLSKEHERMIRSTQRKMLHHRPNKKNTRRDPAQQKRWRWRRRKSQPQELRWRSCRGKQY